MPKVKRKIMTMIIITTMITMTIIIMMVTMSISTVIWMSSYWSFACTFNVIFFINDLNSVSAMDICCSNKNHCSKSHILMVFSNFLFVCNQVRAVIDFHVHKMLFSLFITLCGVSAMDMRCSNNLWYVLMVVFCFLIVSLESNKSFACAYNIVFFIYELMLFIRKGYVLF